MTKIDYKSVRWWKGENIPPQDFIDNINSEFDKIQDSLGKVDGLENEVIEKKSKLLEALIKHYLDLTKVLDQRRGDYYKAALQMTAIGLTGFGLLIKLITFSSANVISFISISICLGLLSLLYTSYKVINTYYWQTKSDRYHFLNVDSTKVNIIGNSWLWFYHGVNGIGEIPYTSNPKSKIEKLNSDKAGVEGYVSGAAFYFDKFINATSKDLLIEDLKHTYLLLIHNAYKNKFDRQLTDIISDGTRRTFWILLITVSISLLSWCLPSVHFTQTESKTKVQLLPDSINVNVIPSKVNADTMMYHTQNNFINRDSNRSASKSASKGDSVIKSHKNATMRSHNTPIKK